MSFQTVILPARQGSASSRYMIPKGDKLVKIYIDPATAEKAKLKAGDAVEMLNGTGDMQDFFGIKKSDGPHVRKLACPKEGGPFTVAFPWAGIMQEIFPHAKNTSVALEVKDVNEKGSVVFVKPGK